MIYIVFGLLGLGIAFTVLRFIIGPHLSDRVVSIDTFNMMIIGVEFQYVSDEVNDD